MLFFNKKINEPQNPLPNFSPNYPVKNLNIQSALRPAGWIHFLLFPLAGWIFSRQPEFPDLILGLLSSIFLLAHAYGFNNYKDNRIQQSAWWHRWPLILLCGVILFQRILPQISAGIFLLISTIYSGRFKLKGLPGCGLALNGLGFALLTLMAVAIPSIQNVWLFLMVALWVSATQLVHEEAHIQQDTQSGHVTTVAILGSKKSRLAALVLLILAASCAFLLNLVFGVALVLYTLIFAYLALRMEANQLRRAMRWWGLLWAGIAGWELLYQAGFSLLR